MEIRRETRSNFFNLDSDAYQIETWLKSYETAQEQQNAFLNWIMICLSSLKIVRILLERARQFAYDIYSSTELVC